MHRFLGSIMRKLGLSICTTSHVGNKTKSLAHCSPQAGAPKLPLRPNKQGWLLPRIHSAMSSPS